MKRLSLIVLWLVVFFTPWVEAVPIAGVGTLARVAGYLSLLVGLGSVLWRGKIRHLDRLHYVVLAFVAWSFLSVIWSEAPATTVDMVAGLVRVAGLTWLIWEFAPGPREQLRVLQGYVAGCCVSGASLYAGFIEAGAASLSDEGEVRFRGAGMNANELAMLFAMSIPLALHLADSELGESAFSRWLYRLYCPLIAVAALLTGSRGGLYVLATGLGVLSIKYFSESFKRGLVFIAALLVGGGGAATVVPEGTFDRLATAGVEATQGTMAGRVDSIVVGVDMFWENPLLGVGSGAFSAAMRSRLGWSQDAHNSFVAVGAETGLLGLVLFSAIPLVLLLRVQKVRTDARYLFTSVLLMWFVSGLSGTFFYAKTTWIVFGVCITYLAWPSRSGGGGSRPAPLWEQPVSVSSLARSSRRTP